MSRQYSQNCLAMTRHDVSDCPATAIVVHGFSKRRSLSTHRLPVRFCEVLNPERTTFDNGSLRRKCRILRQHFVKPTSTPFSEFCRVV
jgi:hypothetical protein